VWRPAEWPPGAIPAGLASTATAVRTARQSCRFTFRLYVDYGAHQYVEPVDNDGKPFTASVGLPFSRFTAIYAVGADPHAPYVRRNPKKFIG
jgi:hypothetical protein